MSDSLRGMLGRARVRRRKGPAVPFGPPIPLDIPTPIVISHRTRSIILWVSFILLLLLAGRVPNIIQILAIGATLALVLSFPMNVLRRFMSKPAAIALVTLGMIGFISLSIAFLVPYVIGEILKSIDSLPATLEKLTDLTNRVLEELYKRNVIDRSPDAAFADMQTRILESGEDVITGLLRNTADTLTASFGVFITAFGVLFIAIYLLVDIPDFKDSYIRLWTPRYRRDAYVLWDTIGFSLSRYLGGLLISLALQGVLAYIGLVILNVPYALLLAIVVSTTAILPFIGAWISAIPAILIALTVSWQTAVGVAVLYVVINQLEGNVITPRIQGDAVRVHPLLIFLGVLAGSRLFGMFGAVMAVPAIAILRVVLEFFWVRLRVDEDHPTVLSAMRADSVQERLANQSPIAEIIEENAERVTREEIVRATHDELRTNED